MPRYQSTTQQWRDANVIEQVPPSAKDIDTIADAPTGVTAGTYGDATHVGQFTVNAAGDLTAASSVAITTSATAGGLGIYGDGSDGSPTFDGAATILGLASVANVYTLARDLWLASPTINTGVTIITNGFRLFASGALTNNGTIQWNGQDAVLNTLGGVTQNANSPVNSNVVGTAGGTSTATGGNIATAAGPPSFGGFGGAGGNGTAVNGPGGQRNPTGPTAAQSSMRSVPFVIFGACQSVTTPDAVFPLMYGGCGGGGGDGDSGSNSGGHGGAGGGFVIVVAKTITGTGAIQARGGKGGNGTSGGLSTGGGGGGGGGWVAVVSSSVSGGAITGQTIDANGGAGGTHFGAAGTDGANGGSGTVILLPN